MGVSGIRLLKHVASFTIRAHSHVVAWLFVYLRQPEGARGIVLAARTSEQRDAEACRIPYLAPLLSNHAVNHTVAILLMSPKVPFVEI